MQHVRLCLTRVSRHAPPTPRSAFRRFHQLLKTCVVQGAILMAAGCSSFGIEVPISATPLTVSDDKPGIDKSQLCLLHKRYSLLDPASDSCSSSDWKLTRADPSDQSKSQKKWSPAMISGMNSSRNQLAIATRSSNAWSNGLHDTSSVHNSLPFFFPPAQPLLVASKLRRCWPPQLAPAPPLAA